MTCHVSTKRSDTLLPIKYLVHPIRSLYEIEQTKGIFFQETINDIRIMLSVTIDIVTLVFWLNN